MPGSPFCVYVMVIIVAPRDISGDARHYFRFRISTPKSCIFITKRNKNVFIKFV